MLILRSSPAPALTILLLPIQMVVSLLFTRRPLAVAVVVAVVVVWLNRRTMFRQGDAPTAVV